MEMAQENSASDLRNQMQQKSQTFYSLSHEVWLYLKSFLFVTMLPYFSDFHSSHVSFFIHLVTQFFSIILCCFVSGFFDSLVVISVHVFSSRNGIRDAKATYPGSGYSCRKRK